MITPYLVEVRGHDAGLSQGTGWFLRPSLLVTALHVVGKVQPNGWAHEVPGQADASYALLGAGPKPLALTPVCYDAASDVALLRCAEPVPGTEVAELAEAIAPGDEWYADGYPGFDRGHEWTLSGRVMQDRHDRLQLLVSQGTTISWAGISGSALRIGRRVAGLITAETPGTNTAWAASAPAIARVVETYDAALVAAELLGDGLVWNTDRERLLEALRGHAEVHPELAAVLERVRALGQRAPAWTVPDAILEELEGYGIGPVRGGFRRLVRQDAADTSTVLYDPWEEFALFLGDAYPRERFGGRAEELAALDAFVESSDGGYFFITGPAGLGKTALLAEWLRCLRARSERPAFHFITGRPTKFVEKPYTETACLHSLCAQLLDIYHLGGDLPREPDRLRRLYARLLTLQPPPEERVIVLLDGLDEALRDWTPGPGMFPELPHRVHVVFSARPVANRDWLQSLRLQLDAEEIRNLDRLRPVEVEEVLSRSGVASGKPDAGALLDAVVSVTKGDPDYVADVIALLAEGADVDAIRGLPEHHSSYLRSWWDSAYDDLREFGGAFEDLMGTLSVLRERLPADDLVQISDADALSKKNVETLIRRAERYLSGDPKGGYKLERSRILDLVADRLEDSIPEYRRRVAEFCRRWNAPRTSKTARSYGLRNAVAHLLQIGRFEDTVGLLGPAWLAAKWQADGSYVGLLDDLDRLVAAAAAEAEGVVETRSDSKNMVVHDFGPAAREKLCRLPALVTARQTARELMAQLPVAVLQAWVRLGEGARAIGLVDALGEYRGQAAQQLLAVSQELLSDPDARVDLDARTVAFRLLGRALSMLNLVRTSAWKIERLEAITDLLACHPLEDAHMVRLIGQARAFGEGCQDVLLRACSLALVARLAAAVPSARTEAEQLLKAAETLAPSIKAEGDRLFFWACALPALRVVSPERPRELVDSLLRGLRSLAVPSRFTPAPAAALIRAWSPKQDDERSTAAALLLEIVRPSVAETTEEAFVPAMIPELLCELGRPDLAKDLVARLSRKSRDACMAVIAPYLVGHNRDFVIGWVREAGSEVEADSLAPVLAALGAWDECQRSLEAIDHPFARKEPLRTCIDRAAGAAAPEAMRIGAIHQLMNLSAPLESEAQAELGAKAALALASLDRGVARAYLERAVQCSLSTLPEGDPDTLRQLWGLLLAENGRHAEALETVRGCTWAHDRVRGCADLIEATPRDQVDVLEAIANLVIEVCRSGSNRIRLGDTLLAACDAAAAVAPTRSERASAICDAVSARASDLRGTDEEGACMLAEIRIRMTLDEAGGRRRLDKFVGWLSRVGVTVLSPPTWSATCKFLVERAQHDADAERHLRDLGRPLAELPDARKRIPYCATYASALAAKDVDEAIGMLEGLAAEVERLRASEEATGAASEAAKAFISTFAELTGRPAVNVSPWAAVLAAVAELEPRARDRLRPAMQRVIDGFLALDLEPRDAIMGAAEIFEAAADLPVEESDTLYGLIDPAIRRLSERLEAGWVEAMVMDALRRLSQKGHSEVARRLLEHLPEGSRETGAGQIGLFSRPKDGASRTAFERVLARADNRGWFANAVRSLGLTAAAVLVVQVLSEHTGNLPRYRILGEFTPDLMLPARELWGLDATGVLVRSVLDGDERFVEAGRLIARGEPE